MSEELAWLARKDGSVVVGHGPFQQVDDPAGSGVAFFKRSFCDSSELPWFVPNHVERLSHQEFQNKFSRSSEKIEIDWQVPDAMPFSLVFQEIMSSINQGLIEKTVPVVTEAGRVRGLQSATSQIIAAMAHQQAPLHAYGWVNQEGGFAGATPELLLSMRGTHLETMALAGTARQEDEAVFCVDEKEIREHEYVAQTLVSKLLDLGKLKRKEREVMRLGSIVHFLTSIQVELDAQLEPRWLLRRLHPTPALGPLPRTDETMNLLGEWRQRLGCPAEFGAPFGVWDHGAFEAVVAIRGLWWKGAEILLPAGCGIIEASRLVNEWRELRLKREAVKRFLL
jgi:menaquinone-specific isochorismate synthase